MRLCKTCSKELVNAHPRRLYCDNKCRWKTENGIWKSYDSQKARGLERKILLILERGGMCSQCGYNKNTAALNFHHTDPSTKKFGVDIRTLSNNSWKTIREEVAKCELLCANCHTEHHNPTLNGLLSQ